MPDDPTTENENEPLPIEPEAWEIAFKPYATDSDAAYDLARRLMEVKRYLTPQPPNVSLAKAALDEACELLFPFTQFHEAGYDLYHVAIDGRPTRAQENLMESLGIRY
jgi:hypothetical protein